MRMSAVRETPALTASEALMSGVRSARALIFATGGAAHSNCRNVILTNCYIGNGTNSDIHKLCIVQLKQDKGTPIPAEYDFQPGINYGVKIFSGRDPNATTIAYKLSESRTKSLGMTSNTQSTWEGRSKRLRNKSNDHAIKKISTRSSND